MHGEKSMEQPDLDRVGMRTVWVMLALPSILLALLIFIYIGLSQAGPASAGTEQVLRRALPYLIAINHLVVFALLYYLLKRRDIPLSSIGLRIHPRSLVDEIALGLVGALVLYLFKEFAIDSVRALVAGHSPTFNSLFRFDLSAIYVPMAVVAAGFVFVEESVFRGFAIPRLSTPFGVTRAVAISSVFFGLLHWGNGGFAVLNGIVFGILFSGFFLWRRTLVAVIVAHAGYNLLVLAT
jgi:membrane protease YdiL (CAAX protease family)